MVISAVVFDLDGVIIDSKEVQRKAFFKSYELVVGEGSPNFEEFLSHAGNSLANIFRKMNLPLKMIPPYQAISLENMHKIRLFPGIKELLVDLRAAGIKIGLCTGKDRIRTLKILEYHQLFQLFDVIVCSDDVRNPKPYPDSLFACMRGMMVSSTETVMIGDAVNDVLCAKNCNVFSIAVLWGETKREVLEQQEPDIICANIPELRAILFERIHRYNLLS